MESKTQRDEESQIESKGADTASPVKERVNPLDDWERPTGLKFYLIYTG